MTCLLVGLLLLLLLFEIENWALRIEERKPIQMGAPLWEPCFDGSLPHILGSPILSPCEAFWGLPFFHLFWVLPFSHCVSLLTGSIRNPTF